MTGGNVMDSNIATAIALKYPPVALIWSEQKPEDVIQFKEMEANVAGSFLERPTWQSLVKNK
jgi:hypothetical protein